MGPCNIPPCLRELSSGVRSAGVLARWRRSRRQFSTAVRGFIKVDAPVVALTNVRVIDGTGAPARENQTLVIRDGNIAAIGEPARVQGARGGARSIDLAGQVGDPRPGDGARAPLLPDRAAACTDSSARASSRLYLAGGVTTMRTGGNMNGFMDLKLKQLIDAGQQPGPAIDATAPYLNGPNTFLQMRDMKDADEARRQVAYWADMGATSFKAYMQISARAARRRDRGGAQARAEGHRPSLLGDLRGGRGPRHRQPRARLPRRDGFRRRQAAGRLSRPGRAASRRSRRSTRTASRSRRW